MVAKIRALKRPAAQASPREKIALYALLISLTAISLDIILPAYQALAREFALGSVTQLQNNVLVFVAGMFVGELVAGFYADILGRRTTLLACVLVYLTGTFLCLFSQDFVVLLIGRSLQGMGAGGQKICTRALIRDNFSGAAMARVMSLVMITFVFLPFLAPGLGLWMLSAGGWRGIFIFLAVFVAGVFAWFWRRQPETLQSAHRNSRGLLSARQLLRAYFRHPRTCGYTLAAGFLFGVHLAIISLSPLVLLHLYGIEREFPWYFGCIAGGFGVALLINAQVVTRMGMLRVVHLSLALLLAAGGIMVLLVLGKSEAPARSILLPYLFVTLFCLGLIFGNLNALIMEPLAAAAGLGNALTSALSTLVALPISYLIGWSYQQTAFSFVAPLFLCSGLAALACAWAQRSEPASFRY